MKYKSVILIILFAAAFIKPQQMNRQQLDSLYDAYLSMSAMGTSNEVNPAIHTELMSVKADTGFIKCGFGTVNEVRVHLNEFTDGQQKVLKVLLSRPITDTSFVTPSGFFRVHYNVFGSQAPGYSLTQLAIALDSAYNFEVNYLGYPPPPSDNGAGGDDKYDVYIQNLGGPSSGSYGYTEFENEVVPGSNRWTSYMVIDNDYAGYYTSGINGARVTVAHEFHHSIQGGDYIYRDEDRFFYELTSTSMETFVYNSIHDYFAYLNDYFRYTNKSFATNDGYDLAIWNIFLKNKYGFDILKKQWQLMPKFRALNAINNSLIDYGSTFGKALSEFGIWTFYTNSRALSGKYFKEAKYYPLVKYLTTIQFQPPTKEVNLDVGAVSNTFISFENPVSLDTLVTVITNSDVQNGINNINSYYSFDYKLFNYSESGSQNLTNTPYSAKFTAAKPSFWLTGEIYNNQVVNSGEYITAQVDYAFPSPFSYSKNQYIFIPVKPDASSSADLNIYTSSMQLVYSSNLQIRYLYGQKVVKWNAENNKNEKLPSGVYLFITKSGNNTTTGKLVIFNE